MKKIDVSQLNLKRPIIVFDLETTSTDTSEARIVEICLVKVLPDGTTKTHTTLVNPGVPIPEGASEVHGIKDEDVKDSPKFKDIAKGVLYFIRDCDLGGYNQLSYDIPVLAEEFERAGIKKHGLFEVKYLDALPVFRDQVPHTLSGACEFYLDKKLDDAHSAEADTLATLEVILESAKCAGISSVEDYDKAWFEGKVPAEIPTEFIPKGTNLENFPSFRLVKTRIDGGFG
jgi:DNA polymerase-3 subunit epsilon